MGGLAPGEKIGLGTQQCGLSWVVLNMRLIVGCAFRFCRLAGQEETRPLAKTVMDGRQRAGKLHACLALAKVSAKKLRDRDLKL